MINIATQSTRAVTLIVNGRVVKANPPTRQNLADFVREGLGLSGTHVGCEHGVCGACHLRVNGTVVRGCLYLAVQADGASVETIEGLSSTGEIADLQKAFVQRNAMQCGFCTPGMLMIAAQIVSCGASRSREEIREALSGNYCRCTGYESIVDAIETVSRTRSERT